MTMPAPTTMEPSRYRHLLEIAAREFATAGYERASLNRIIRSCGMSKSSFYHFFDSKAALFDAVVREAASAMAGELDIPSPDELAGSAFWKGIESLAGQLVALTDAEPRYVDFGRIVYLPDAPLESSAALRDVLARIATWVERALASGGATGAVRTDLPASLLTELTIAVLQAMDRWSLQHLAETDPDDRDRLAHLQVDVLRRLLAAPESLPRGYSKAAIHSHDGTSA